MFSEKVRAKCSGGNVTQTAVAADRPGNQDGFRGRALCAVWGMGSSVLPTALEAVAVAVHFQDMHVVGETVQQRAGEPFRTEHVGPPKRNRTWAVENRQSCSTIESPGPSVICQPVSFGGIDWHLVLQVRRHHIDSMDGLNEVDFHQVTDDGRVAGSEG